LIAELPLSFSQLFLYRTDLSEHVTRFEGIGEHLLTEFQLLLKYLGVADERGSITTFRS